MAIGTPTKIVAATSGANVSTMGITIPAGGVAAGLDLFIFVGNTNGAQTHATSAADNSTQTGTANTYTVDAYGEDTIPFGSAIVHTQLTRALLQNDVITVSFGGQVSGASAVVYTVTGLAASPLDKIAPDSHSFGTTPSAALSAATTQADEIIFGWWIWDSATDNLTAGTGYTKLESQTGVAGLSRTLGIVYRIVAATGSYTPQGTFSGNQSWAGAGASYKGGAGSPANTTLPSLTGTTSPGQTLAGAVGTWTNSPTSYSNQFQRETGFNTGAYSNVGGAISGTSPTYALTTADSARRIRMVTTATNANGSTAATSAPVGPVGYAYSGSISNGAIEICSAGVTGTYIQGAAQPFPPPDVITAPGWKFVLDAGGTSLGELVAYSRSLTFGISRGATATCRIRADDPLWLSAEALCNLRVYNYVGNLVFYGPIISDEESADGSGASVTLTAADPSWMLGHRFYAKDPTGVGAKFTATDSGDIMYTILNAANAEDPTGLLTGTKDQFITRNIDYLWKRALDVLNELGALQGSYEWSIRYLDGSPPAAFLDLRDFLGSDQTAAIFLEYGTGSTNCTTYRRTRSAEQMANHVWVLGSGSTTVEEAFDVGSEAAVGRYEDVVSYGDISDAALLASLASAHVAIRKMPRAIVSLTPLQNTMRYGIHWGVGDFVTARVVVNSQVRVNGAARIWGGTVTIDEAGNERVDLQLEPN